MDTLGTVLLVDGDGEVTHRAALALEAEGFDTDIRPEPPSVTALRRESTGEDGVADCVVTETKFPDRDGLEFAADVRSSLESTPIVVYTGHGNEQVASRAFTVGVAEYVRKSEGPSALVDAVDRVLRASESMSDSWNSSLPWGDSPAVEAPSDAAANEKRLCCELERYRTIVEEVADMVYALDAEGTVRFSNQQFAGVFDRTGDETVGTHASEFLSETAYETAHQLIRTLLKSEETNHGTYEFTVPRANGDPQTFENNMTLLVEDGEFCGTVGVLRDVTERNRQKQKLERQKQELERQKQELERQNERLDAFASIVSHDLRNPINVIAGKVELLRLTEELSHLDEIKECTDQMEALLTDLLALAREGRDVEEIDTVSLERIAIGAWRHVPTENGQLSLDSNLGTIEADPNRLEQLFENLYRNALEHGAGARADTVRRSQTGDRSARQQVDGSAVTVTVESLVDGFAISDDGPGIDPADVENIFDRGYTTSDTGTGFGLSIVERIVDAHGWSIDVDTDHDGARFVIRT